MKTSGKTYIALHLLLMLYSISGVFSKLAASYSFMSLEFMTLYALMILILGIYAIGWQQILKRMPLTTAFSNKAATVVWGIVWGVVIFSENLTCPKIVGGILIIVGVILYSRADGIEGTRINNE